MSRQEHYVLSLALCGPKKGWKVTIETPHSLKHLQLTPTLLRCQSVPKHTSQRKYDPSTATTMPLRSILHPPTGSRLCGDLGCKSPPATPTSHRQTSHHGDPAVTTTQDGPQPPSNLKHFIRSSPPTGRTNDNRVVKPKSEDEELLIFIAVRPRSSQSVSNTNTTLNALLNGQGQQIWTLTTRIRPLARPNKHTQLPAPCHNHLTLVEKVAIHATKVPDLEKATPLTALGSAAPLLPPAAAAASPAINNPAPP